MPTKSWNPSVLSESIKDVAARDATHTLLTRGIYVADTPEKHAVMARMASIGYATWCGNHNDTDFWEPGRKLASTAIASKFQHDISALLVGVYDWIAAKRLGEWVEETFHVESPRTPRNGKVLKQKLQTLTWVLKNRVLAGLPMGVSEEDALVHVYGESTDAVLDKAQDEVGSLWKEVAPKLADMVQMFTEEGGVSEPKELRLGANTYVNSAGLGANLLEKYAKRLESILEKLSGWRARAAKGGLTIVLASPRDFRGTSSGKYRSSEDALYVRATPAVLKRGEGYASFEYVVIHELGHRYEYKFGVPEDFDTPVWWTTKYSKSGGVGMSEAFAELFALGHFKLSGSWDPAIQTKFEELMS